MLTAWRRTFCIRLGPFAREVCGRPSPFPRFASELAALLLAGRELAVREKGTMHSEQSYLGCLSHASYMLASEGEAIVVDPQQDVDIYFKAAVQKGVADA